MNQKLGYTLKEGSKFSSFYYVLVLRMTKDIIVGDKSHI